MQIRKATEQDIARIMEIYDDARQYMRAHGNLEQWNQSYPSRDLIEQDIADGYSHVCEEDGSLIGVFFYREGEDPTYQIIYEGAWLNDKPYGVIHRIAVSSHERGVASACFSYCFALCKNLKIDTHRDNYPMQRALEKNGFSRCGIIHLENGDERIAYQKTR